MHIGFTNVILLCSEHRAVSVTPVVIFRVVSERIQIYIYIHMYSVSGSLHS